MASKTLTLPNGIIIAGERVREIEIAKLDGEHDDMLRDKENLREGNILDKFVRSSVLRVGDESDKTKVDEILRQKLKMADMTYILIQLRIYGVGKNYRFEIPCPSCTFINRPTCKLDELPVDEQKEEFSKLETFMRTVTTEDGDETAVIEFVHLYTKDQSMLDVIRQDYPKDKDTRELLLQLKTVNGQKPDVKTLKKMSHMLRHAIRLEMDKVVGGVDTTLVNTCKRCEREFKENLPVDVRDFLYPTPATAEPRWAIPYRFYGATSLSLPPDGDGPETK